MTERSTLARWRWTITATIGLLLAGVTVGAILGLRVVLH
jgi:hypothetical protein